GRGRETRDRSRGIDYMTLGQEALPRQAAKTGTFSVPVLTPCLRGDAQEARRSRRLFVTTRTELSAIAAPAIIGLSRPVAASGIAATLYANAQNRFCLMIRNVAREMRTAAAAARRSPRTR